jgi:hypothetical protein
MLQNRYGTIRPIYRVYLFDAQNCLSHDMIPVIRDIYEKNNIELWIYD